MNPNHKSQNYQHMQLQYDQDETQTHYNPQQQHPNYSHPPQHYLHDPKAHGYPQQQDSKNPHRQPHNNPHGFHVYDNPQSQYYIYQHPHLHNYPHGFQSYNEQQNNPNQLNDVQRAKLLQKIDTFHKMIKEGKEALQIDNEKEVVLVIGKTGVGKSTCVNYVSGAAMKLEIVQGEFSQIKYLVLETPSSKRPTIGAGGSVTTLPNKWHDPKTGITYWDCPGFEDTKGIEQDIANAFFIKEVFKTPKVKIVLLVQETSLSENRGDTFFDLMRKVDNLLRSLEHYSPAFSIIVTQGDKSLGQVMEAINICIKTYGTEKIKQDQTIGEFLKTLLKNKKIALFTNKTEEKDIYNDRDALQDLITKGTSYVPSKGVSITLKHSYANELRDIASVLNEHIKDRINQLCKNIIEECQKTAKEAEQTKSVDAIGSILKVLKELNKNLLLIVDECEKERGNNFKMFLSKISEKITQNKGINLKQADFSEIESYLNHINLLKNIDPKAAVQISLETWLTEFRKFNTHTEKQIFYVQGIIKSCMNDESMYIELIIKDLNRVIKEKTHALEIQFSEENLNSLDNFVAKVSEVVRFLEGEEQKKILGIEGLVNHMKTVFPTINFEPLQNAITKERLLNDDHNPSSKLFEAVKFNVLLFNANLNSEYMKTINFAFEKSSEVIDTSIKEFFIKIQSYYSNTSQSINTSQEFINQLENERLCLKSKSSFLKDRDIYDKNYDNAIIQMNLCQRVADSFQFKNRVQKFETDFQELYSLTLQQLTQLHKQKTEDVYNYVQKNVEMHLNDFAKIIFEAAHNKQKAGMIVKLFQEHNPTDFVQSIMQLSKSSELVSILGDVSTLINIQELFQYLEGTSDSKREVFSLAEWKQKIRQIVAGAQDSENASLQADFRLGVSIFSNDLKNNFNLRISEGKLSTYSRIIDKFKQSVKLELMNEENIGKLVTAFEKIDKDLKINSVFLKGKMLLMKSVNVFRNTSDLQEYLQTSQHIDSEEKFRINLNNIYNYIFNPRNVFASDATSNPVLSYIHAESAFSKLIKEACQEASISFTIEKSEYIKRVIQIVRQKPTIQKKQQDRCQVCVGRFIKLSDVKDFTLPTIIVAQNAVYFDKDIVCNTNIAIFAPRWHIPASRCINLSGQDGDVQIQTAAENSQGHQFNLNGINGNDGLPGNSGQHSGNFYGILDDPHSQLENLTLVANGGNGSNGQDAGNGSDGCPGNDATEVNLRSEKTEKEDFGFFWWKTKFLYVEKGQKGGKGGNSGQPGEGGYGGDKGIVSVYLAGKKLLGFSSSFSSSSKDLHIIQNPGNKGSDGKKGCAGLGAKNGRSKQQWYCEEEQQWLGSEVFVDQIGKNINGSVQQTLVPAIILPSKKGEYDAFLKFKQEYRNEMKQKIDEMIELDLIEYEINDQFLNTINLSGNKLSPNCVGDLGYNPYFNQYTSIAIEKILELRLQEIGAQKVVRVLPAKFCSNQSRAMSSMMIIKVLESLASQDVEFAVLPYNVSMQHWVGVVFSKITDIKGNGRFKIAYLDSEGQDMPISLFESTIHNITGLFNFSCFVEGKVVRTQSAGNCGPETVENIAEYVSGALGIKHIAYAEEDVVPHHSSLFEADLMSGFGHMRQ